VVSYIFYFATEPLKSTSIYLWFLFYIDTTFGDNQIKKINHSMKQSKELTKELEDSKNEYQRKVKQLFNESEDDLNNRTDVNTENEQNELTYLEAIVLIQWLLFYN